MIGVLTKHWTKGMIVPLFQKGEHDDVNNHYRGITILRGLGKQL